ncbi:hypothetical protein NBRC10513v2_001381 [Rhodotorula toruloides]|uniref:BY PROTMAP: gi/472580454/gb/EMS18254.1/ aldo/keto reductase [Rhodosporidium toruloides NP11] gi/647395127/emb/CDR36323.1/ RHTO0S02e00364g1_1 [Rhodosporidium toruloides] n=1 Tax=Rhodotorula toruloides TaxID=5286 RepID=A0A0K3CPC5_RHOTO|nr:NADP-dependent oxidoreductase domain-containing protein [Rhodotorula toruloides]
MTASVPSFVLNSGARIPSVGLGCWMGAPVTAGSAVDEETYTMVRNALDAGYTHFDTASGYRSEEAVGKAIRDSGIAREKLFVTTKLALARKSVVDAFEQSLKKLDVGYIDLYLMHWPLTIDASTGKTIPFPQSPTFSEVWIEMEKLLETHKGKVRSIGVSNFSIKNLEILLKTAKVVPAVNQVEGHPYLPSLELDGYCKSKGIHMTAYSPLGAGATSPLLTDDLVLSLAAKYDSTPAAVVLAWNVARGWSVVPKSSNPTRLKQNITLPPLSTSDLSLLSSLHKSSPSKHRSLFVYPGSGEKGDLFGWRVKEDLGWEYEVRSEVPEWMK